MLNLNPEKGDQLSKSLTKNIEQLKAIFSYPDNKDFTIREIYIKALKRDGVLVYMAGMAEVEIIEKHMIAPLMSKGFEVMPEKDGLKALMKQVIYTSNAKIIEKFSSIKRSILADQAILLVEGYTKVIALGTAGPEHRAIQKPQIETVIRGPKEAFIESEEINRALVRKRLRNEHLVTEVLNVGKESTTQISIMYLKNVANPNLVKRVKERISEIEVDTLQNLSLLEQHIEERSYSLVPSVLSTERPDRASAFLQEGHIALIDNSPSALIVPVTFFSFFHTGEDQYQRWAYGNFIRILRLFAFFVALITPSFYVAITNFHVEMLPTDLLLSIAGTRENVPFPAIIEVLMMELAFELVREAGTRIPATIGPTIGIVGALILGQAAVEATIVSPIMVIVVALTGLSSFAIPEVSTNYMVRIARFGFLALATFLGFYGIAFGIVCSVAYLTSIKSFGVPFLAPMAPHYPSSKDLIVRPPVWKQWLRPLYVEPLKKIRSKKPE